LRPDHGLRAERRGRARDDDVLGRLRRDADGGARAIAHMTAGSDRAAAQRERGGEERPGEVTMCVHDRSFLARLAYAQADTTSSLPEAPYQRSRGTGEGGRPLALGVISGLAHDGSDEDGAPMLQSPTGAQPREDSCWRAHWGGRQRA